MFACHHEGWCHTHVECMCMLTNAKRHEPNRKSTGWLNSAKANINRWPIFLNTSVMYHTLLIESHLQVILKRTKYYNWKTVVRDGTKVFEFPFTWSLYSLRPLCCLNVQLLSAGHAELVSWTPYQLAMSRLPHGLLLSGAHALSVTWCLAIKTSFYFLFSIYCAPITIIHYFMWLVLFGLFLKQWRFHQCKISDWTIATVWSIGILQP